MKLTTLRGLLVAFAACTAVSMPAIAPAQQQQVVSSVYRMRMSFPTYVHTLERQSNEFRQTFENKYRRMFISNIRESDAAKNAVQRLDKSIETIYKRTVNTKPRYLRDDVAKVLRNARELDAMLSHKEQVLTTMSPEWNSLKASINELAGLYDMEAID